MLPVKDISSPGKSTASRRLFLGIGIKLAGWSALFLPLQKAFGSGSILISDHAQKLEQRMRKVFFANKLILNTKTKVVHLPTEKIFTHYQDIAVKNQKVIELANWEEELKTTHFNKEKSGIILELLALQKLTTGINDKNLAATTNTLAMVFSPPYMDNNIYNFRVHDLLLHTIALNNSISPNLKWNEFRLATAGINYNSYSGLPQRMKWLKTEIEFNNQVNYIINNRTTYMSRLKERAIKYKL